MASTPTVRTYLITGGARGIGCGLSRLLLQKGHRVFLLDNNATELKHTAAKLSEKHKRGTDFEAATCNLRKPDEIKSAAEQASKLFDGKLDCLINNAAYTGGVGAAHVSELSLEDWNASVETNLTGPFLMTQGCLPMLSKSASRQAGTVIHMSSTRAFMSEPNNEGYSTTKAGLIGMMQSMAISLGPQGVGVNAILPGWINVANECKEADEKNMSWEEGLTEADNQWHPTGRVGKVEDILRAVEYLVDNDGVSGTEVVVDGGVTRKMVYPEE